MNPFDKQLREKLSEEEINLNPDHLDQFDRLLDSTANARRKWFIWWIPGILLAVLGTTIIMYQMISSQQIIADVPVSTPAVDETLIMPGLANQPGRAASRYPQTESDSIQGKSNLYEESNRFPGNQTGTVREETSPAQVKTKSIQQQSSVQQRPDLETPSGKAVLKTDRNVNPRDKATMHVDPLNGKGTTQSKDVVRTGFTSTGNGSDPANPAESAGKDSPINRIPAETRYVPARIPPLVSGILADQTAGPAMNSLVPIPPKRLSNWHFGLTGGFGLPGKNPSAAAGANHRFDIGGFALRRMKDRFSLGINAGLTSQGGGIDFEKSSSVIQYGFGLRSAVNTLRVDKAFFGHIGIFAQYHIRRHFLEGGITALYLYGAKGEISRFTSDDFAGTGEERLRDTWIETDGLRKISLSGSIGYGYRIARNLDLVGRMRIPIMGTTYERKQYFLDEDYYIDSKKQRIMPELAVRIYLFRI